MKVFGDKIMERENKNNPLDNPPVEKGENRNAKINNIGSKKGNEPEKDRKLLVDKPGAYLLEEKADDEKDSK